METWNLFGKNYTEDDFLDAVKKGEIIVEVVTDPKKIESFMDNILKDVNEE